MENSRINASARWYGIVRFLNFDIRSGRSTVLVGCKEYAPSGRIIEVDHETSKFLHGIMQKYRHGKKISEFVGVVDQWVIGRALELAL